MKVLVVGGDITQDLCALGLEKKGHDVVRMMTPSTLSVQGEQMLREAADADMILLPLPATEDGIHLYTQRKGEKLPLSLICVAGGNSEIFGGMVPPILVEKYGVADYCRRESFRQELGAITGECAVGLAICTTPTALRGRRAAIIGAGYVTNALVSLLRAMDMGITVYAQEDRQRAALRSRGITCLPMERLMYGEGYDLVLNTVSSHVLSHDDRILAGNMYYLELAPAPGGLERPEKLGKRYVPAADVARKYASASVSSAILRCVDTLLKKGNGAVGG